MMVRDFAVEWCCQCMACNCERAVGIAATYRGEAWSVSWVYEDVQLPFFAIATRGDAMCRRQWALVSKCLTMRIAERRFAAGEAVANQRCGRSSASVGSSPVVQSRLHT
jgi:hypothetical protein